MNSIIWPEEFTPGKTDNYVSNEIIISGLSAENVWFFLNDTSAWPSYYSNVSNIELLDGKGTKLAAGTNFKFVTFGLPIDAKILEHEPPKDGKPARLAWHGWAVGEASTNRMDAYHAWLIEDLPDNRVRILTQETQNGEPAKVLAKTIPNPMLNAHQEWIDGLAKAALSTITNNKVDTGEIDEVI